MGPPVPSSVTLCLAYVLVPFILLLFRLGHSLTSASASFLHHYGLGYFFGLDLYFLVSSMTRLGLVSRIVVLLFIDLANISLDCFSLFSRTVDYGLASDSISC